MNKLYSLKTQINKLLPHPAIYQWAREIRNRYFRYKHYEQLHNNTSHDRYPEIFSFVSNYVRQNGYDNITTLSFGCSTGEECFSLRTYLPTAQIVGLDINRDNLNTCIHLNSDPKIKFLYSNEDNMRQYSPYDIIFAMSVLCRWPDTKAVDDCSKIYPFNNFDKKVKLFDQMLKPGGLLVIFNSNFLFTDTLTASKYEKVDIPGYQESGFVAKFSSLNQRLTNKKYPWCVFKKTRDLE